MSSPRAAMRRALHLIRLLQREPADRATLQAAICEREGADAYHHATGRTLQKAFEDDLRRAHEIFGVTIRYDRSQRCYRIMEIDAHGWIDLPDDVIDVLALVYRTFDEEAPQGDRVRHLLDGIVALLPAERRRAILRRRPAFLLALDDLDREVDPRVFERVRTAVEQRKALRFLHRSPRQAHDAPNRFEIEPRDLQHRDGHLYLHGFARWVEDARGRHPIEQERRFRLSYILPDEIQLLPEKLPTVARPLRTRTLRYRLHPDIARGHISERFPNTRVEYLDDGWAEVTATISDEFGAAQSLMRYGDKCIVLEPPGVVDRIRAWLWGMMALYER